MNSHVLGGSFRLRLFVGSLVWTLLALALAGWGLRNLFQAHITQQLQAQLVQQLDQLSAAIDWRADGSISAVAPGSDPRLQQPLSGLYWQIDELGARPRVALARSRSLWDQVLRVPPASTAHPSQGYWALPARDANGNELLVVARTLDLPDEGAPPLGLVVAADTALLAEPLGRFTRQLLVALGLLAAGLMVAVAVQLQLALHPLKRLRLRLAAVRGGKASRIEGRFPLELQPLVQEFNHVLAQNTEMVQRARTEAGNLAHAVHTPLSILATAAEHDPSPLALLVREQVASARRQVDYYLARARATAAVRATGLNTPVLEPVRALFRTMQRLHGEHGLSLELAPQARDLAFRGEAQDLYEMLGNLIDNAGKWARSRVLVDVQPEGGQLCLTIDDDGPGIDPAERERMFERGVQLDERHPGAGLGLDIVRTLATTYGGRVEADTSALGGARLKLYVPIAED